VALVMRSVRLWKGSVLARSYEGIADILPLDSHPKSDLQIGALGVTHDWSISRRIVEQVRTPVIPACGLGPEMSPTPSAPRASVPDKN
jgi:phosphoribosylanthranilate isomerase